jgi:uncharacterized protein YndB with AHSA1/START domain
MAISGKFSGWILQVFLNNSQKQLKRIMPKNHPWTNAVFTRIIKSNRNDVFRAWSEEKQVAVWWGPYGFIVPVCKWNAKQKGNIYLEMRSPDGMTFPLTGFFHEVIASEQLLFSTTAFKENLEILTSVILTDLNGKTKITVEATVMKAIPEVYCFLETMYEGWKQSLDKLEIHLQKKNLNKSL